MLNFFRKKSIVGNLTLWFAFSFGTLLAGSSYYLYRSLKRSLFTENEIILNDRIQTIVSLLERKEHPIESLKRRVESEWALRHFEKIYVRVENEDWKVVTQTPETPSWVESTAFRAKYIQEFFASQREPIRLSSPHGDPVLLLAMVVKTPESTANWAVFVAMDLEVENKVLDRYRWRLVFVVLSAFAAAIAIGWLIARRGLRPLKSMTETLSQINSQNLSARITTDVPIELEILKTTFNQLLEKIESSMQRLSQFSSDIAHEIRTPINNLRGEIEVSLSRARTVEEYRRILESNLEECHRMKSIVDSLLFLARSEGPHSDLSMQKIDVRVEIDKLIEFYEPSATDAGIVLKTDVPSAIELRADRALLQTAIGNLLSNAIRYTPRGGTITISARARANDQHVTIEVRDTGIGISSEHLPYVFDRLYRVDQQRASTMTHNFGLGLSIVRAILQLHKGSASITSTPDQGTSVFLEFPSV